LLVALNLPLSLFTFESIYHHGRQLVKGPRQIVRQQGDEVADAWS